MKSHLQPRARSLALLFWTAALLPFLSVHSSFFLAASQGHVDWCMPYWDSCTSISATGRQMPEKALFKLGMLPSAFLMGFLWWHIRRWLMLALAEKSRHRINSMFTLGCLAGFFLLLYTLALGVEGDSFQRLRRIGVTLSFAFTFLSQLLCTQLFGQVARLSGDAAMLAWHRALLGLLSLLLLVGIASLVLDAQLGDVYDAMEDAFEWNLALLLQLWFAGAAVLLAKTTIQH